MNNTNEPLRRERMPFLIKRRATRSQSMVRRDGDGPERPPHPLLPSVLSLHPPSLHSRLVVRKTFPACFDDLPAWGQIAAAAAGRRRGMKAPDGMPCPLGRVVDADADADAVVVCVDGVCVAVAGRSFHVMSGKGPRGRQTGRTRRPPAGSWRTVALESKVGGAGKKLPNWRLNLQRGKPWGGPDKCRFIMARRTWW